MRYTCSHHVNFLLLVLINYYLLTYSQELHREKKQPQAKPFEFQMFILMYCILEK